MEKLSPRLFNWASILEPATREQATTTATMPFIHPHVALMPDAHLGLGATVGSVIPTLRAIMPAAVGVDIGCGMIAVRTQFTRAQLPRYAAGLREAIERAVPLSAGSYNTSVTREHTRVRVADLEQRAVRAKFDPGSYAANWRLQLGTLGSGNHFIEVTVDEQDRVWLFLHSGSRGVGNRIAQQHIKVAQELCARWWIGLPHKDLAYLVEGTDEFWTYIRQMRWAQHFALLNREEMMDRVVAAVREWVGSEVQRVEEINCHHNYTEEEKYFGKKVWLSRKGAISARAGEPGLIPGSMGTASYVVEGRGNPVALHSSPHGAGRAHSRSAARRLFTREQLREVMAGTEYRDTDAFVDEIPIVSRDLALVKVAVADTPRQLVTRNANTN